MLFDLCYLVLFYLCYFIGVIRLMLLFPSGKKKIKHRDMQDLHSPKFTVSKARKTSSVLAEIEFWKSKDGAGDFPAQALEAEEFQGISQTIPKTHIFYPTANPQDATDEMWDVLQQEFKKKKKLKNQLLRGDNLNFCLLRCSSVTFPVLLEFTIPGAAAFLFLFCSFC